MDATPLIAIFGAAVRPDGRPSAALFRRILMGVQAARAHPEASILCTGGVGRHGPSEASVMAEVLVGREIGVERLILDEASLDTLQSAVATARIARERQVSVVVCSDGYHVPRIRVMLWVLGAASRRGPATGPANRGAIAHRLFMGARECVALPYDFAIVLVRRRSLMA